MENITWDLCHDISNQFVSDLRRCLSSELRCTSTAKKQQQLYSGWQLSEQSDREANECWLNRWVVTLLHWRGFTGDMMHCFTKAVGWQWACFVWNVNLCLYLKARGVAFMCSLHIFNWCLHNLLTALVLFHWHFMTSQSFSSAYPMFPSGQWMLYFQSLNMLLVLTAAFLDGLSHFRLGCRKLGVFLLTKTLF